MANKKVSYKEMMKCRKLTDFCKNEPEPKIKKCTICGRLKIPFGTIVVGYTDLPCLCDDNMKIETLQKK